jgi:adenylate cyclase
VPIEYERKFLVTDEGWRTEIASRDELFQGYLAITARGNVRVRVDGSQAWITVKGTGSGESRPEFEYTIPLDEAKEMLDLIAQSYVSKVRYTLARGPFKWTVDEFQGESIGLILLEVESDAPIDSLSLPEWVGLEVTDDARYTNAMLSRQPYGSWQ